MLLTRASKIVYRQHRPRADINLPAAPRLPLLTLAVSLTTRKSAFVIRRSLPSSAADVWGLTAWLLDQVIGPEHRLFRAYHVDAAPVHHVGPVGEPGNATFQACHEFTSEEPDDLAGNLLACAAGCEQFVPSTIDKPGFGFGRYQSFSPFRTAHGLAVGIGLHATDKMVTRPLSRGALRRI